MLRLPIHMTELAEWPEGGYLFPRALHIPGWKHMWDNLLQRGLSSLRFFPSWLEKFRALVPFLRRQAVQVKFGEHLRSKGLHALALILEGTALPSFADWRWGTLKQCMKLAAKILMQLCSKMLRRALAWTK